jgi:hypothetical protein
LNSDFRLKVYERKSEFKLKFFSSFSLCNEQQEFKLGLESFLNPSPSLGFVCPTAVTELLSQGHEGFFPFHFVFDLGVAFIRIFSTPKIVRQEL